MGRPLTVAATSFDTARLQLAEAKHKTMAITRVESNLPGERYRTLEPVIISGLCFGLFNLFDNGRHYLKQVSNNTVICRFEDGRALVFVDGHYRFRALHPDEMLNGA